VSKTNDDFKKEYKSFAFNLQTDVASPFDGSSEKRRQNINMHKSSEVLLKTSNGLVKKNRKRTIE